MGAGPDAARVGRHRRVVQEPQDGIALAHGGVEELFLQPKVQGDGLKHALAHLVQSLEQAMDGRLEVGDLTGPQIGGHVGGRGGEFAPDVPEFLQVVVVMALGGLDAERRVAALARAAGHKVGGLGVLRQGEEVLRRLIGPRDKARVQAVVRQNGETVPFERGPQFCGETRLVRACQSQRDGNEGNRIFGHRSKPLCDAVPAPR